MVEQKKKSNIFLAFLLSMLTALAGGILFGIIYGIGYYVYILAIGEIILATGVYLKFAPKTNWQNITLAIIWCVIWTFIFNLLAVVICEALFIAKELGVNFADAYKTVMELWKTDAEVKSYMNKRILEISGMILIGGIVYGIFFIVNISKAKKASNNQPTSEVSIQTNNLTENKPQQISNNQPSTPQSTQQLYLEIYEECKASLLKYAKNKDQETFKLEIKEIKAKHISSLDSETKQNLTIMINKVSLKEDLPTAAKKTNELLLKMIK